MNAAESETAVLGACLIESGAIGEVADYLRPHDFFQEPHREIYDVMLDMWSLGEPISEVTVTAKLRERKKLKLAGGAAYVSSLANDMPDVANIEWYADQVKENALAWQLKVAGKLLQTAEGDPREILNETLEKLVNVSADSLKSVPESIGHHVQGVCDRAIKIYHKEIVPEVVLTGMPKFDAITGGLNASDLIILGARPSVGKSAFSLWIAKLVAEKGKRVLFFSLEMSSEQIATRLLAAESGVPYSRIQDGYLSQKQPDILTEASQRIRNLPLLIDDRSGQSIGDIRTKARRESARGGVDLVIVDYIQIAAADSTDYQAVTSVSNGLKALAKDLSIPVIGLSQLSRGIENRDSKKPQLSDLKQTGALEQDADMVFFLWYPDLRKKNDIQLVMAKNRNGALGEVTYGFNKEVQTFEEMGGGRI